MLLIIFIYLLFFQYKRYRQLGEEWSPGHVLYTWGLIGAGSTLELYDLQHWVLLPMALFLNDPECQLGAASTLDHLFLPTSLLLGLFVGFSSHHIYNDKYCWLWYAYSSQIANKIFFKALQQVTPMNTLYLVNWTQACFDRSYHKLRTLYLAGLLMGGLFLLLIIDEHLLDFSDLLSWEQDTHLALLWCNTILILAYLLKFWLPYILTTLPTHTDTDIVFRLYHSPAPTLDRRAAPEFFRKHNMPWRFFYLMQLYHIYEISPQQYTWCPPIHDHPAELQKLADTSRNYALFLARHAAAGKKARPAREHGSYYFRQPDSAIWHVKGLWATQ